jgi:hypothetical protein
MLFVLVKPILECGARAEPDRTTFGRAEPARLGVMFNEFRAMLQASVIEIVGEPAKPCWVRESIDNEFEIMWHYTLVMGIRRRSTSTCDIDAGTAVLHFRTFGCPEIDWRPAFAPRMVKLQPRSPIGEKFPPL